MANPTIEELIKRLDDQHQAYLETFRLVHESLAQSQAAPAAPLRSPSPPLMSSPPPILPSIKRLRRTTLEFDAEHLSPVRSSTIQSSILTGEDTSDDEDDGDLYVQTPLPSSKFDHEHLRAHLKNFQFGEASLKLLESVIAENGRLLNPSLFQDYANDDLSHNSHYSVYDVGADGAPVDRHQPGTGTIDKLIWKAIRDVNATPERETKAVGRITIVREPSPIIFGALHLTMKDHFDMEELYTHLVSQEITNAHMDRAFSSLPLHQRSFFFKFEYYTVVGPECQPMPWQLANYTLTESSHHIPISRCGAVVALSLSGPPIRKLRNVSRHAKTLHGFVHDPWAPWKVLNIQCYPDHKHTMDIHDSTKHYVNGPEAFMYTLLAEFKDAQKRYEEIYQRISKLISPGPDFMFDGELRDKLLFEDSSFTYSRRYFWAYQTLGIMNQGIRAMIDAYRTSFTDDVWEGQNKSLWPMTDPNSSRSTYFKKRMRTLREEFEREIRGLERIQEGNDERRKEIRTLRDQLFSGTSVLESRKSVEMSQITVQQGHNIKLLTLVSIFFLPLTFVTSVFGMTIMPTDDGFVNFAIVMTTVCVPFFLLIGSLNTTKGMEFWRMKTLTIICWITRKPFPESYIEEEAVEVERETWGIPKPQEKITIVKSPSYAKARAVRMTQIRQPPMSRSSTMYSETESFRLGSAPATLPVQNFGAGETNITIQEIPDMEKQEIPNNSSSDMIAQVKVVPNNEPNKNMVVSQDRVGTDQSMPTDVGKDGNKNREWKWVQKVLWRRKHHANKNNDMNHV